MSNQRLHYYMLDAAGNVVACDLLTWARWYETSGLRRVVERTELPGGVVVSTVFLGVDHRLSGEGPPLLWETMTFRGDVGDEQRRYASREEAVAGHALTVSEVVNAKE